MKIMIPFAIEAAGTGWCGLTIPAARLMSQLISVGGCSRMHRKMSPMAEDAIAIADALRAATNRAADLLEQLDTQNTTMRSAELGVLADGTPVEDMLEQLREVQAENAKLHRLLRDISYQANRKASERADAIVNIRQLAAER